MKIKNRYFLQPSGGLVKHPTQELEELRSLLEVIGVFTWEERQYGWSNQPTVICFYPTQNLNGLNVLETLARKYWIHIEKMSWKTTDPEAKKVLKKLRGDK